MASLEIEWEHGFDHDQEQTHTDPIVFNIKTSFLTVCSHASTLLGSTLVTIEYWFNKVDNLRSQIAIIRWILTSNRHPVSTSVRYQANDALQDRVTKKDGAPLPACLNMVIFYP
jgi:hypothetical protein